MTDFGGDLTAEKLEQIQSNIDRIESELQEALSEVDEAKGDISRLETIEFLDRGNESRQIIVHWLEDTDPETIVSLGDARDAFVEFSELRAEDEPNEHQVAHGDVLVIGGDCPWYALCAKIDRGKGGGDAGFQDADPMGVAGTEKENDEPYKQFIVWGGCGNGEGDDGGDGDGDGCVGTPSSIAVSTALATTSGGAGPIMQLTKMFTPDDAPNPPDEMTFNSGLSDFTIVEDANATVENSASFLAFDDSDITICDNDCGIKLNLKKTELEKKLHKIKAKPIEQKKVTILPKKLETKEYTSQTGTITVSTATISSDKCGNLSSDGGGGGGTTFGLATLVEGALIEENEADLLDIQDVDPADIPQVSVGNLTLPTDFTQSVISGISAIEDKKAFIPMLGDAEGCPKSESVDYYGSFSVSISEDDSECDSDGGCKNVTLSITPSVGRLVFKCGLLVDSVAPTSAGVTPIEKSFKVPCGCESEEPEVCDNGASGSLRLTFDGNFVATLEVTPQCTFSGGGYTIQTNDQGNWELIDPGANVHIRLGGGFTGHFGTDYVASRPE